MIEIRVREKKRTFEIEVSGHAGYHPGNDIVCAGVSAITSALIGHAVKKRFRGLKWRLECGNAYFRCRDKRAIEAVQMAVTGYAMICRKYENWAHLEVTNAHGKKVDRKKIT